MWKGNLHNGFCTSVENAYFCALKYLTSEGSFFQYRRKSTTGWIAWLDFQAPQVTQPPYRGQNTHDIINIKTFSINIGNIERILVSRTCEHLIMTLDKVSMLFNVIHSNKPHLIVATRFTATKNRLLSVSVEKIIRLLPQTSLDLVSKTSFVDKSAATINSKQDITQL